MARLNHTGAETGDTSELQVDNNAGVSSSIKRSGNFAWEFACTGTGKTAQLAIVPSNLSGFWFIRVWCYIGSGGTPSGATRILWIHPLADSGSDQFSIDLNTDRTLSLRDDGGALIGTSSAVAEGEWFRIDIEFDNTVTASTEATAWLNGTQFATGTYAGSTTNVGALSFGVLENVTATIYMDDIAINDAVGTEEITMPSATGKIIHLYPSANGDSNGTQGTDWDTGPTTGQSMVQMVDEAAPANDATDYIELIVNSTGVANRFVDFTLQSPSAAGIGASDVISVVSTGIRVFPETNAGCTFVERLKSQASGTVIEASVTITGTAWVTHDDSAVARQPKIRAHTDPQAGGPWTRALLETTQIGVRATDALPDIWVSSLWALVEYTPVAAGNPYHAYAQQ